MEPMLETAEQPAAAPPEATTTPQPIAQPAFWARLSVAGGLLLLVALLAGIMRFVGLGRVPLSPAEAQQALAVWRFLQPEQVAAPSGSPAYFTLTSLLAPFLGVSDATVRLAPALFGVGLVLLPWLLRERIGSVAALMAALLLAVSPLNAIAARTAGGEAIALFALLLTAVAAVNYLDTHSDRWLYTLAAAVGLGLSSATLFYSGLATLALAWILQRQVGPPLVAADQRDGRARLVDRASLLKAAGLAAAVLVAVSTRLLTAPAGLGATAGLLGEWLGQFAWQGDLQALLDPFLALGRYETVLVLLGIFAILWAVWNNHALGTTLVYWLLGGLILMLLQRGVMANALVILLPGYLLLGLFTGALLQPRLDRRSLFLAAGIPVLLAAVLVNVTRFLRISAYEQQLLNVWIAVLALAAVALAVYALWTAAPRAAVQGAWLGVLVVLLFFQWGTGWYLTRAGANDPRERWVGEATAAEAPLLASTLRDISRQVSNADNDVEIFSAVDTPALRWYLRDFNRLTVGAAVPPGAQQAIVITPAGEAEPLLGSDYLGSDFGLLRREPEQTFLSETPLLDALRWWLFHESSNQFLEQDVIVWVRADLVAPDAE